MPALPMRALPMRALPMRTLASRALATRASWLERGQIRVGDRAHAVRTFTEEQVSLFASLTLDSNPLHSSAEFAVDSRFGDRIVHGMLYASMYSAIVGQNFPGSIYLSQSLIFRKPVLLGDTVTAVIEVKEVNTGGRVLTFGTHSVNQREEVVLSGEARVLMPKQQRERSHASVIVE